MRKRVCSRSLSLVLSLVMVLGVLLPSTLILADTEINTLRVEIPEDAYISRSWQVEINNLYNIKGITVDNGEVLSYSQDKDSVTVNVYNGKPTTIKAHYKDVEIIETSSINIFDDVINYNLNGYAGVLNKSGLTFNNPNYIQKYFGKVVNEKANYYKYIVTIKYTENVASKIKLDKPQIDSTVNSTIVIDGIVTDENTGDEISMYYSIDEDSKGLLFDQGFVKTQGYNFKESVNLGVYTEGMHNLNIWAIDKGGIKSEVKKVPFTIDRTAPTVPIINISNEKDPSQFDTITIDYPSDASKKYYKIGKDGEKKGYTGPFPISVNGTVYASAVDAAGNESDWSCVEIKNIDTTPPSAPEIVVSPSAVTGNEPINVTINPGDEGDELEYSLSGTVNKDWIKGNSFSIDNVGKTTINARAIDKAGNISAVTTKEVNINAPTPTNTPTNAPTPTTDPNATPTTDPNATPTTDPNVTPTTDPNVTPTTDPNAPTTDPNVTPTTDPNVIPTKDPNAKPTIASNVTPTAIPTPTPTKKKKSGGGGGFIPFDKVPAAALSKGDLAVYITSDETRYEENETIEFTLKYKNKMENELTNVVVSADVPDYTTYIEGSEGTVKDKRVQWKIGKLAGNAMGELKYKLKVNQLDKTEIMLTNTANVKSDIEAVNTDDDESKFFLLLYSNRYENKTHSKYITGYEDNSFRQENSITRAEVATIISKLLNLEKSTPDGKVYPDVSQNHWGYGYIYAATKTGLFTGYEDGSFHPDSNITRAEVTVVISKYLKLNKIEPFSINFTDINNHWAASFIEEIYRVKFIEGYLDSNVRTFKPDANIKRSEAVTIFNNVFFRGPLKGSETPFSDIQQGHWAYEQVAEASGDHSYIRDDKFETKVDKK